MSFKEPNYEKENIMMIFRDPLDWSQKTKP